MLNYDPTDCSVALEDPDAEGNLKPSAMFDDEGELDQHKLHGLISESVDIVVNQARQACSCDEATKHSQGKAKDGDVEVCLPCEARDAINAMLDVASQG